MGLPGFRKAIQPACERLIVSDLIEADKTLGVDAFVPLHKFVTRHATLLQDEQHDDYNKGCARVAEDYRNWIIFLQSKGVKVLSVFDGAKMPGKIVNMSRRLSIARAQASYDTLMLDHHHGLSKSAQSEFDAEVRKLLKQMAAVKEPVVMACLAELRKSGLSYIRAPYEADAQLVHEVKIGTVQAVYTEDSDLIIHGVDHVIVAYNKLRDHSFCSVTQAALAAHEQEDPLNPLLGTIHDMVHTQQWKVSDVLVPYSILMGCDYMKKVRNVTSIRACSIIRGMTASTPKQLLASCKGYQCQTEKGDRKIVLRDTLGEEIDRAWKCFRAPWVYDNASNTFKLLNELHDLDHAWNALH